MEQVDLGFPGDGVSGRGCGSDNFRRTEVYFRESVGLKVCLGSPADVNQSLVPEVAFLGERVATESGVDADLEGVENSGFACYNHASVTCRRTFRSGEDSKI